MVLDAGAHQPHARPQPCQAMAQLSSRHPTWAPHRRPPPVSPLAQRAAGARPARRCPPAAAVPPGFEPRLPDPEVLYSQLAVLGITVGAAGYWWLQVRGLRVPDHDPGAGGPASLAVRSIGWCRPARRRQGAAAATAHRLVPASTTPPVRCRRRHRRQGPDHPTRSRWAQVVPAARSSLAKDKRAGPSRAYLENLQTDDSRGLERWFYTGGCTRATTGSAMAAAGSAAWLSIDPGHAPRPAHTLPLPRVARCA